MGLGEWHDRTTHGTVEGGQTGKGHKRGMWGGQGVRRN